MTMPTMIAARRTYSSLRRATLALVMLAVAGWAEADAVTGPGPDTAQPAIDFLADHMDRSVNPGVDFFQYANATWLKQHPIPPSESAWGIGSVVKEQLYESLRAINEKAAAQPQAAHSDQQKIGDFWASAIDSAKAEQQGVHPLDAELARIAAITTLREAVAVAFAQQPLGTGALFGLAISQDERASDTMAVHLTQGGLGLPERDFYFNKDKDIAHIRQQYQRHIGRTLALLGSEPRAAAAAAHQVMAFETALAKLSRKLEALRDPVANYHKMTLAEVQTKLTPVIDWSAQLASLNIRPSTVIVGQPEFYTGLQALLAVTPVPVLRDYLRYHLVHVYSPYLSQAFDDEHFSFAHRVLSGQRQPRPRWKRVLDAQDTVMGMALGRLFVEQHFPPAAKQRYTDLVEAIRTAYRERIDQLDWMSEDTKARARTKLAAITPKVGYPDHWKDYSTLTIGREAYATNMMTAARWNFEQTVAKLGKPVDRNEWDMSPQTYNAYYNPSNNEIVLPAASFLINGVNDAEVDDAVVYGYAGATTIGHEITHGFDDEGRQFDAVGNLSDWWTVADARNFEQRAQVMVVQFNRYQPFPGMHINGKATLGENIADYGGALLGLDAFKKTEQYKQGQLIGGLTPVQRYFLGYALGWMNQVRDASLRSQLLSDVHAPSKWRVLGPLSNMPEFHEAFGIQPGQPMYRAPAERVRIW